MRLFGGLLEKRNFLILLFVLFLVLIFIFIGKVDERGSQGTDIGYWEGAYGAQYPYIEDYDELASRGINLVVNNITTEPDGWENYYRQVIDRNLKIIPVLWGVDQTAWVWNQTANEWELDIYRYPNSIGAKFLQYLRDHPEYLQHTFAVYAFHEPFNPQNPKLVSPSRIRKFWQQIHEEEFPDRNLQIYGESISWNSACANGCVDFDTISLYNFTECGIGGLLNYRIIEAVPGNDGLLIRPGSCTYNKQRVIQAGKDLIDALYDFSQHSLPAPDGSRTEFFVLIQTFSQENPGLNYRMPEASEMYEWGTRIVYPQGKKVAGLQWYVFRFDGLYDQTLGNNRFDQEGEDRWKTISQVAATLFGFEVTNDD